MKSVVSNKPKDDASSAGRRSVRSMVLIVGVILACLGGIVAISQLFLINGSIRLDESQSLWQTSHSLEGTLKVIAQDVHVPLYHIVLHFWQLAVGPSIESARLLSLLFFMSSVPLVYLLARNILTRNWSLLVTVLFSFSPFMNWYGNEARMYTMLVFVSLLSQLFFLKIVGSKGSRGWLGYTLTAMVGIYTHYFFMFGLAVQGLYVLATRKQFAKRTVLKLTALAGLLAVEFLPWFLYFRSLGSASNTSPLLSVPSTVDFFNVLSQFSFGFQTDAINTVLVSLWPLLVVVALLAVKQGQKVDLKLGYILAAALGPIVLAFLVSHAVRPFFVSRYMIACLPALLILTVWFISNYRSMLRNLMVAMTILVLTASAWVQYGSSQTPIKEDFKAASAYISANADSRDIIVLSAPFSVYPFNYYYDGNTKVATLPTWDRTVPGSIPAFDQEQLPAQINGLNDGHQYVYLLLSSDQGYEEDIFQYYERRFENTYTRQFSHDLRLEVYRVGYSQLKPISDL